MPDDALHKKPSERKGKRWRLSLQGLQALAAMIPNIEPPQQRVYLLALVLLRNWFGQSWVQTHVIAKSPPTGFLKNDLSTAERIAVHTYRVIELTEMILNLQEISGWTTCMDQLAGGDIESAFAELDSVKLCFTCGVQVKFHAKEEIKGRDFDLDVIFPNGVSGCADVKCKVEAQENQFKPSAILQALEQARKQLDKNIPGLIILKIPPLWMDTVL